MAATCGQHRQRLSSYTLISPGLRPRMQQKSRYALASLQPASHRPPQPHMRAVAVAVLGTAAVVDCIKTLSHSSAPAVGGLELVVGGADAGV